MKFELKKLILDSIKKRDLIKFNINLIYNKLD